MSKRSFECVAPDSGKKSRVSKNATDWTASQLGAYLRKNNLSAAADAVEQTKISGAYIPNITCVESVSIICGDNAPPDVRMKTLSAVKKLQVNKEVAEQFAEQINDEIDKEEEANVEKANSGYSTIVGAFSITVTLAFWMWFGLPWMVAIPAGLIILAILIPKKGEVASGLKSFLIIMSVVVFATCKVYYGLNKWISLFSMFVVLGMSTHA